jgi:hypothetical protein
METLEQDIYQQETGLIVKLKEQTTILKTTLRDKENELLVLKSQYSGLQEQIFCQSSLIDQKEKDAVGLKGLTNQLLSLNSNIQTSLEKSESEKLDIARQLEYLAQDSANQASAFVSQIQELKQTCSELIRQGEQAAMKFASEMNSKQSENSNLQRSVDDLRNAYSLLQKELDQKQRISQNAQENLIIQKESDHKSFYKLVEEMKESIRTKDLHIQELTTLLKVAPKTEEQLAEKDKEIDRIRNDLENRIQELKFTQQAEIAKFDKFKQELKEKYKRKLILMNENHDEQLISLTSDYKKECIAIRAENKELFEENTSLKVENANLKDQSTRLTNNKDEIIFVTQKSAKQDKRRLDDKIVELENTISIMAAEKADLLTDFDNFQSQVNSLKTIKFQLLKENKLLINKLINFTEYPSLRPDQRIRSMSPRHLLSYAKNPEELDPKSSLIKYKNKAYVDVNSQNHSSEYENTHKTQVMNKNPSKYDEDLSIKQTFLNNFSLTPKFVDQGHKNDSFLPPRKQNPLANILKSNIKSHKVTFDKSKPRNSEKYEMNLEFENFGKNQVSALEMIKDFRQKCQTLENILQAKEEENQGLMESISAMKSQMKEVCLLSSERMDEIQLLSDQNHTLSLKTDKLGAELRSHLIESQNMQAQLIEKEKFIGEVNDKCQNLQEV